MRRKVIVKKWSFRRHRSSGGGMSMPLVGEKVHGEFYGHLKIPRGQVDFSSSIEKVVRKSLVSKSDTYYVLEGPPRSGLGSMGVRATTGPAANDRPDQHASWLLGTRPSGISVTG